MPANPRAWLIRTGQNKAIDRIRRDVVFRTKVQGREIASAEADAAAIAEDEGDGTFGDDRLRLIFTCCHPALSAEAHIALTLREVCGLTTQAVARAFLVSEETMAQRLVRAKKKIRDAGIPYETPEPPFLNQRIQGVLAVVYGLFTEGYARDGRTRLVDAELCGEAIRLGRCWTNYCRSIAAVLGLLALMLLHDARRGARVSADGDVVLLEDQDRSLVGSGKNRRRSRARRTGIEYARADQPLCGAGRDRRVACAGKNERGHRLAANRRPVRGTAAAAAQPDHRAEPRGGGSMVDGAARALDLVDSLAARGQVSEYHLLHAARGRFLQQLGRPNEAREAYRAALELATLEPERRLLMARIASIDEPRPMEL